jgi:hypothetical protein
VRSFELVGSVSLVNLQLEQYSSCSFDIR